MRAFIAETKLQHRHARNLQTVSQRMHFRSDIAQVLRVTVDPNAIYGRRIASWNLPELIEAAKVIEADVIAVLCGPAQPLDPPFGNSRSFITSQW